MRQMSGIVDNANDGCLLTCRINQQLRDWSLKCRAGDDDNQLISCLRSTRTKLDENGDADELAGDVSAFLHGDRARPVPSESQRPPVDKPFVVIVSGGPTRMRTVVAVGPTTGRDVVRFVLASRPRFSSHWAPECGVRRNRYPQVVSAVRLLSDDVFLTSQKISVVYVSYFWPLKF